MRSLLEATFDTEANGVCLPSQGTLPHAKFTAVICLPSANHPDAHSCSPAPFECRKEACTARDETVRQPAFRRVVRVLRLSNAAICVGFARYDAGLDSRAGYGANSTPDFCESPDFTGLWMNCG